MSAWKSAKPCHHRGFNLALVFALSILDMSFLRGFSSVSVLLCLYHCIKACWGLGGTGGGGEFGPKNVWEGRIFVPRIPFFVSFFLLFSFFSPCASPPLFVMFAVPYINCSLECEEGNL